jgi:transcriptional/translational regulatory protein YebC/TACO1
MSAEMSMVSDVEISLDGERTAKILRLIDRLEENGDVQDAYSNIKIPEGFVLE